MVIMGRLQLPSPLQPPVARSAGGARVAHARDARNTLALISARIAVEDPTQSPHSENAGYCGSTTPRHRRPQPQPPPPPPQSVHSATTAAQETSMERPFSDCARHAPTYMSTYALLHKQNSITPQLDTTTTQGTFAPNGSLCSHIQYPQK
jgi:hypothetical protein